MVQSDPKLRLPTSAELPCSDDTPVDNENQNFIPNLLLFLLKFIWGNRSDWFFGVDMGIYHTTGVSPLVPVVPDGFLSLGVERHSSGKQRKSYVVWEENGVVPIFTLEIVSLTPGGEYDKKMAIYANLGVLYYVIYNPEYWQRDRHQPFEVYRLVDGEYKLQIGEPYWMSEINLGIGRAPYWDGEVEIEALYWYDQQGNRYLTAEERAEQQRQRAQSAEQARRDSIPRLLGMGLSVEQVAEALNLTVEEVRQSAQQ
ncbi:MAG: Uma2 family endonuclease [Kastovskya adunca ATA6-11-RM4]|jgi:Uma2 family endonuclease|nr:Uma2 family endonuclease [Kastovskya adunca ATA6-11-RM4]